jgi:eukaryotic-like serine/threonine-protein kinase
MTWLPDRALDRLRTADDPPDLSGTRYSLLDMLGRGGMGAVYRVQDTVLDREVAMKVLDDTADSHLAQRLVMEARVLASLEHPGLVPVHDAGTLADGRPYYVMKLVRGRDLCAHITPQVTIPERLRLFERICEAVAVGHAHGVIHRDLKPANVMVGPFGEVLVMDWGLAKARHGTPPEPGTNEAATITAPPVTGHGTVLGTPGYMAPEQRAGRPTDERTDVFALGVLLQWLLTAPTGSRPEGTPRPLKSMIAHASADAPRDRYAGVDELVDDVRRYLDGLAVSAHAEGMIERLARFQRRHRVAIALIVAYLLMRIVLLAFTRL